jgi:hypothetical protein
MNFFINRDLTDFNARVISITDIKNNMIESCKESWFLFFEDNISKFRKDIIVRWLTLITLNSVPMKTSYDFAILSLD